MTSQTDMSSMERHPDLMEMRARYERAEGTTFAQAVEALAIITGLFLAVAPWVVGFNQFNNLAINDLVTGIGYAALLGGFAHAYQRSHARAWAATLIGIWTIIAPWCVANSADNTRSVTTHIIVGALATLLGLAMSSLAGRASRDRTGRDSARRTGRGSTRRTGIAEPSSTYEQRVDGRDTTYREGASGPDATNRRDTDER